MKLTFIKLSLDIHGLNKIKHNLVHLDILVPWYLLSKKAARIKWAAPPWVR